MPRPDDERIASFVILAVGLILVSGVVAKRMFGYEQAAQHAVVGVGILVTIVGVVVLLLTQYRVLRRDRGR